MLTPAELAPRLAAIDPAPDLDGRHRIDEQVRGVYFALFREARLPLAVTGSAVGLVSIVGYTPDVFMGPLMGRFGVPRLYLPAPEGEYSLLAGSPDEAAPVYELERVREMVLAVAAATATPGTVDRNPAYSAAARLARGRGLHMVLLWSAIVLVVGVLAWMTLRLARE